MLGLCWILLSCLGPMLGFVGLSLAHLGTMLPPRVALGLCSLYFGLMLAHLGTMLGLCWILLSCLGPMLGFVGLSLAHLGTMLRPRGCFGPMFTLFWAYVGPSWDYVRTMLGFVGSSWAYVGPSWDYVGPSWVLCLAILALCWPILGLWKKDMKVQKLYENMFTSQFFTVVAVFFYT